MNHGRTHMATFPSTIGWQRVGGGVDTGAPLYTRSLTGSNGDAGVCLRSRSI